MKKLNFSKRIGWLAYLSLSVILIMTGCREYNASPPRAGPYLYFSGHHQSFPYQSFPFTSAPCQYFAERASFCQ